MGYRLAPGNREDVMEIFGARNRIVKSQVWLGGLAAYVESNGEEQISAAVELTHFKAQATGVPLLVTGGASRLFSTLRTEPRYVEPFMTLVEDVHNGLEETQSLSDFRVRDQVGDPRVLAMSETLVAEAEVAGIVPVLVGEQAAPSEASAAMTLRFRRRTGPAVMHTFHGGPKNPLVTIATWAATLDECARTQPAEQFVAPVLKGLRALMQTWEESGNPQRIMDGYQVEQLVATETMNAGVA
jgi:hypothetical protein